MSGIEIASGGHRAHACGMLASRRDFDQARGYGDAALREGDAARTRGRVSADGGGPPASFEEGHTMSERAIQENRSWTSDLVAVALYSVVVVLLLLSWVYIPA